MLQGEVLVGKGLGAVDTGAARAVAVEEVAALAHEVGDLPPVSSRGLYLRMGGATSGALREREHTIRWNLEPL